MDSLIVTGLPHNGQINGLRSMLSISQGSSANRMESLSNFDAGAC